MMGNIKIYSNLRERSSIRIQLKMIACMDIMKHSGTLFKINAKKENKNNIYTFQLLDFLTLRLSL